MSQNNVQQHFGMSRMNAAPPLQQPHHPTMRVHQQNFIGTQNMYGNPQDQHYQQPVLNNGGAHPFGMQRVYNPVPLQQIQRPVPQQGSPHLYGRQTMNVVTNPQHPQLFQQTGQSRQPTPQNLDNRPSDLQHGTNDSLRQHPAQPHARLSQARVPVTANFVPATARDPTKAQCKNEECIVLRKELIRLHDHCHKGRQANSRMRDMGLDLRASYMVHTESYNKVQQENVTLRNLLEGFRQQLGQKTNDLRECRTRLEALTARLLPLENANQRLANGYNGGLVAQAPQAPFTGARGAPASFDGRHVASRYYHPTPNAPAPVNDLQGPPALYDVAQVAGQMRPREEPETSNNNDDVVFLHQRTNLTNEPDDIQQPASFVDLLNAPLDASEAFGEPSAGPKTIQQPSGNGGPLPNPEASRESSAGPVPALEPSTGDGPSPNPEASPKTPPNTEGDQPPAKRPCVEKQKKKTYNLLWRNSTDAHLQLRMDVIKTREEMEALAAFQSLKRWDFYTKDPVTGEIVIQDHSKDQLRLADEDQSAMDDQWADILAVADGEIEASEERKKECRRLKAKGADEFEKAYKVKHALAGSPPAQKTAATAATPPAAARQADLEPTASPSNPQKQPRKRAPKKPSPAAAPKPTAPSPTSVTKPATAAPKKGRGKGKKTLAAEAAAAAAELAAAEEEELMATLAQGDVEEEEAAAAAAVAVVVAEEEEDDLFGGNVEGGEVEEDAVAGPEVVGSVGEHGEALSQEERPVVETVEENGEDTMGGFLAEAVEGVEYDSDRESNWSEEE